MPRVTLAFLLLLFVPFLSAQLVEVPVSDERVLEPSLAETDPAAAGDASGLVVAWIGNRNGRLCALASRLTAEGTNLDPTGIVLDCDGSQVRPAVALGGDRAVIVYVLERAVRVVTLDRREGRIVARTDVYADFTTADFAPRAAWNGADFLVTWNEPIFGRGRLVTRDGVAGERLDFTGNILGLTVRGGDFFAVTLNRTQPCRGLCTLVHNVERLGPRDAAPSVYATFEATARLITPAAFDLATNGSGFVFVWVDPGRNTFVGATNAVFLDTAGRKTGETTLATGNAIASARATVLWTGSEYFVGYTRATEFILQRLGGEAFPLGTGTGAIAHTAGRLFSVWSGLPGNSGQPLRARFLDEEHDRQFALRVGTQHAPRVATNGDDVFVVWREGHVAKATLLRGAARVKRIDIGPTTEAPDVAFDGRHYLVVRSNGAQIFARMFDTEGNAVGEELALPRLEAQSVEQMPRVAAGRDGFLVVWRSALLNHARISAIVITANGLVLQSRPINVTPEGDHHSAPAVTAMGDDYLVASEIFDPFVAVSVGIRVSRLTHDGLLLHSVRIESGGANRPSIAASNRDALVVWNRGAGVHAARITPQLVVGPTLDLGEGASADVAYDGNAYRVVTAYTELRGLTVQADDALAPFAIGGGAEYPRLPAIAIVQGRPVVAFGRPVEELGASARVFVRYGSHLARRRAATR